MASDTYNGSSRRVSYPNSVPRRAKVIAADPQVEPLVRRLTEGQDRRQAFFLYRMEEGDAARLATSAAPGDQLVVISAGATVPAALETLGSACRATGIRLTIIKLEQAQDGRWSGTDTIRDLRRHAAMLVRANDPSAAEAILESLRV